MMEINTVWLEGLFCQMPSVIRVHVTMVVHLFTLTAKTVHGLATRHRLMTGMDTSDLCNEILNLFFHGYRRELGALWSRSRVLYLVLKRIKALVCCFEACR